MNFPHSIWLGSACDGGGIFLKHNCFSHLRTLLPCPSQEHIYVVIKSGTYDIGFDLQGVYRPYSILPLANPMVDPLVDPMVDPLWALGP